MTAALSLAPESPASPNASDDRTAYIVMVALATIAALAVIAGLLSAVRGRPGGEAEPTKRTRGTTDVQRVNGREVTVQLPEVAGPELAGRIALLDAASLTMVSAASMLTSASSPRNRIRNQRCSCPR